MTIFPSAFAAISAAATASVKPSTANVPAIQRCVFITYLLPIRSRACSSRGLSAVHLRRRLCVRSGIDLEIEFLGVNRRGLPEIGFLPRHAGKNYSRCRRNIVDDALDISFGVERMGGDHHRPVKDGERASAHLLRIGST